MQSKIDQHHIGMDFHNCKKRKMQAALNLEGPTFTALYNQVQTALNDHILVSVADNNEYEAIPQPFRASMTAVLNNVLGNNHDQICRRAISILIYRRLRGFDSVINLNSFTQGPNPVLVDATGMNNRLNQLENQVLQIQQMQAQMQAQQAQMQNTLDNIAHHLGAEDA